MNTNETNSASAQPSAAATRAAEKIAEIDDLVLFIDGRGCDNWETKYPPIDEIAAIIHAEFTSPAMSNPTIVEELAQVIARLEKNYGTVSFHSKPGHGYPSEVCVNNALHEMQQDFERLKQLRDKLTSV